MTGSRFLPTIVLAFLASSFHAVGVVLVALDYPIVDTNQQDFFWSTEIVACTLMDANHPFYGQDASCRGNPSSLRNNGDGTIVI